MGGMRGSTHNRVPIALKLPQLQNLVKRDKDGYRDEFLQQHRNYLSELEIFKLKPSKDSDRFAELVTFMSHVTPCYREESKDFGPQIKSLLEQHGPVLHHSIRMKLVQALILLRNRGVFDPTELLTLFFSLFHCQDKGLRVLLYEHIVSDIKNINEKGRNPKLNKAVQNVVFAMLKDDSEIAAKKSLDIMVELYRKKVWVDARTVNVIASALLAETPKLLCTALNFFLNIDTQMADDDDDEIKAETAPSEVNRHAHSKKTVKRARSVHKQVKINKKKNKAAHSDNSGLFPAINLLHDPQGMAEKVFRRLRQSKQRFEVKLLIMNFISRVTGAHRLLLLPFYSHLQRYVVSQQREVTHILAYLVQACHDLVPPDEIMPSIKAIAYNFVTERCSGEVMALGINSVREIARRIPALLEEEGMDALVLDLAAYSRHRDKSVVVAARGFINFVRETYPSLLKSKDRGRVHDITARPIKYGDARVAEGVDGAELLTLHEKGLLPLDGEDMDADEDDEDENAPELVVLPAEPMDESESRDVMGDAKTKQGGDGEGVGRSSTVDEAGVEENMEESVMEEEEDDFDRPSKRVRGEDSEDEDVDEDEVDDEGSDTIRAHKRLRHLGSIGEDDGKAEGGGGEGDGDGEQSTVVKSRKQLREERKMLGKSAEGAREANELEAQGTNTTTDPCKVHVPVKERVDSTRLLTAEDFEKIKLLKQQAANAPRDGKGKPKRKVAPVDAGGSDSEDEDGGAGAAMNGGESFAVAPESLEGYKKRRRATLQERLESIIRGREKFQHQTHPGGLTNLEKQRKKNFLMVRKGDTVHRKTKMGEKQVMAHKRKSAGKAQSKRDRRKKRRT